jgi:hypothetical protein
VPHVVFDEQSRVGWRHGVTVTVDSCAPHIRFKCWTGISYFIIIGQAIRCHPSRHCSDGNPLLDSKEMDPYGDATWGGKPLW